MNDHTTTDPIPTKTCSVCGLEKPIDEYYSRGKNRGLFLYCKTCHKEKSKRYLRSEKGRAWKREYKKTHSWYEQYGGKEYMREYSAQPERRKAKEEYDQSELGKLTRKERSARYYQNNKQKFAARGAVNRSVKSGKIPCAADCLCVECGKPAVEYHHHLGYKREHWFDIIPLCKFHHALTYTNPHEKKEG